MNEGERQHAALVAAGELAAVLAHEVRNPLTAIRIDLQHVQERLPDGSPLAAALARALREVNRLDRTVNGVLRIARSGSIPADLIDLRTPLQRAAEVAGPAFTQRGATLSVDGTEAGPVPVRGDEAALEQLFLNLLLNAAQALAPGGAAAVTVRVDAQSVRIAIRDTGSGMTAAQLGRVFEPFFTTRADGTGLGLPIARQIVAAHEGSIGIESEGGTGTTVTVTLPSRR